MMQTIHSLISKTFHLGKSACDQFSSTCFPSLHQSTRSVSKDFRNAKSHALFKFREKVSDIFELLVQINAWLEQMKNDDLYIDGIRRILLVKLSKFEIQFFSKFQILDS